MKKKKLKFVHAELDTMITSVALLQSAEISMHARLKRLENHAADLDTGFNSLAYKLAALQTALEDMADDGPQMPPEAVAKVRAYLGWPVEPVGISDRLPRVLTADDPEPPCGSVVLDRDDAAWQRGDDSHWRHRCQHGRQAAWTYLAHTFGPLTLLREGTEK